MKVTRDIIEAGQSSNGGWSQEQLRQIGVDWPPVKGWKDQVIGSDFSAAKVEEFLRLKDAHLPVESDGERRTGPVRS